VARMQEQLGVPLLRIDGRKAVLTEAGEVLLRRSRQLVTQAGGRIGLMAGAGLNARNIATIAGHSGCTELHASAKALRRSTMRHHNPALIGLESDWIQSDAEQVSALRQALDQLV